MTKIKDVILVIFPLHLQMLEFSPVQGEFQWKNRNLSSVYDTLLEKKMLIYTENSSFLFFLVEGIKQY